MDSSLSLVAARLAVGAASLGFIAILAWFLTRAAAYAFALQARSYRGGVALFLKSIEFCERLSGTLAAMLVFRQFRRSASQDEVIAPPEPRQLEPVEVPPIGAPERPIRAINFSSGGFALRSTIFTNRG